MIETIERAKGEAARLQRTVADLAVLDPAQAEAARWSIQDILEWLHGLWMEAAEPSYRQRAPFRKADGQDVDTRF